MMLTFSDASYIIISLKGERERERGGGTVKALLLNLYNYSLLTSPNLTCFNKHSNQLSY